MATGPQWSETQRLPLKRDNTNEFAKEIVSLGFALDLDKKTHTILVTRVYPQSPRRKKVGPFWGFWVPVCLNRDGTRFSARNEISLIAFRNSRAA